MVQLLRWIKGRFGKRESVAIGAAVVVIGGAFLSRRFLEEQKRLAELRDRWKSVSSYPPSIVVLYFPGNNSLSISDSFLDNDYGVYQARSLDDAVGACRELANVRAVVTPRRLSRLTDTGIPVLRPSEIRGGLEKQVLSSNAKTYLALRLVAGDFESRLNSTFSVESRAPEDVSRAIDYLVKSLWLRVLTIDAHRGGAHAMTRTGNPIGPKGRYPLPGICIKVEELSDIKQIIEDTEHFRKNQTATLASARAYAGVPNQDNRVYVERDYYFGPSVASVIATVSRFSMDGHLTLESRLAQGIIRNTMDAIFNVATRYQGFKQEQMDRKRIEPSVKETLEYYRSSSVAAYKAAEPVLCGKVPREMLESALMVLENESVRKPRFYGIVMDSLLPNFKLNLGIEDPGIEELLNFYFRKGEVIPPREIEENLVVYDQGFKKRNYFDTFVRAGLSGYHGGVERMDWIALAKNYTAKMAYGTAVRSGFFSGLIGRGALEPRDTAVNLFAISAYRLFRLAGDAIMAAIENEKAFACGRIDPKEYLAKRELYEANARVYGRNLELVALTGCLLFDNPMRFPGSLDSLWARVGDSFREAQEMANHTGTPSMLDTAIASQLAAYSMLGAAVHSSGPQLEELLQRSRQECPYVVEFRH